VTGAEHRARIQMPEGVEFRTAEAGSGTTRTTGQIPLPDLETTHAQFTCIHFSNRGVVDYQSSLLRLGRRNDRYGAKASLSATPEIARLPPSRPWSLLKLVPSSGPRGVSVPGRKPTAAKKLCHTWWGICGATMRDPDSPG
jgi:hypothetical protein